MAESFGEDEFAAFMNKSELGNQTSEFYDRIREDFQTFLESRGVLFLEHKDTPSWYDRQAQSDDQLSVRERLLGKLLDSVERDTLNRRRGMRDDAGMSRIDLILMLSNQAELNRLTGIFYDVTVTNTIQGPWYSEEGLTAIKQHLQARYYAKNSDPAWVELVERAFPGQPLTSASDPLVDQVRQEITASREAAHTWLSIRTQEIRDYLLLEGRVVLTDDEERAIDTLAHLSDERSMRDAPSRAEEAVIYLVRHRIMNETWRHIINYFF